MNWHYEKNGASVGPVSEAELHVARNSGEVQAATRVWREGWPDWKVAGDVWKTSEVTPPTLPGATGLIGRCAECGQPHADLISLAGVPVCPDCKPRVVAKVREGVPIGINGTFAGPWRDGKFLVVAKDGPLPDCCVKCGEPPTTLLKRTLTWHHPAIYLTILVSLLIYVIVALIVRKTRKLKVPVCARCNSRRKRNIAIGWLIFVLAVALFILSATYNAGDDAVMPLVLAGSGMLVFMLIWAVSVQFIMARKITDQFTWIKKVGVKMLETLPPFPGA